jgi:hypothetical protein
MAEPETHEMPGAPQVFAIQNSRDMLKKLRWEIDELRGDSGHPGWQGVAYRAFNCAVTAWTLTDWLWAEVSDHHKHANFGSRLKNFQSVCRRNSTDLDICESLANSGKHRSRRAKQYNADVVTKTITEVRRLRCGDPVGQPFATWKWEAVILHDGTEKKAIDVFEQAYLAWARLIDQYSPGTASSD